MNRRRWMQVSLTFCLLPFVGCNSTSAPVKNDGAMDVLCSFYPVYLFTKEIVGSREKVRVMLMLPAELGCPHDYDLKPDDARKIAQADVFVINGAGLESFGVKQIKKSNPNVKIVDSSNGIELLDEEEEGHDEHSHEGHDHHHHHGGNPHFFSSPRQAAQQVRAIALGLAKADPEGSDHYKIRAEAYARKLEKLADEFKQRIEKVPNKRIVTMHEVFDYLARDCGLEVVATIQASPGHDPSAGQMRKVIETIKEKKGAAVFVEPQYSDKIGAAIAKGAGVPSFQLDPVASGPADRDSSYYETVMRANLTTLEKALAGETK